MAVECVLTGTHSPEKVPTRFYLTGFVKARYVVTPIFTKYVDSKEIKKWINRKNDREIAYQKTRLKCTPF